MKRAFTIFGFIAMAAIVVAGCGGQSIANDEEKTEVAKIVVKTMQTHCPIMGNPVDKEVYVDYEGKRVYFCCPPCKDKFNQDPAGYIKEMEAKGIAFEKVACEEDHDHGEHDHGEAHDHPEGDHDHDEAHDHDHDDHAGHDHG